MKNNTVAWGCCVSRYIDNTIIYSTTTMINTTITPPIWEPLNPTPIS